MIKPITVQILAYGQKGNITKVRNICRDFLEDELDEVPEGAIEEAEAAAVADEILAALWDQDNALMKVQKSHAAVRITLAEVHERMATEFLQEQKMAKTCVFFAAWHSDNADEDHQLLYVKGEKWSDSR